VDVYPGLACRAPERDAGQHGTITITLYYTVAGGVPSEADVQSAIHDLEQLYQACPSDKRLVDCTEVTAELTVATMQDVKQKVVQQPYVPPTFPAALDRGFPEDAEGLDALDGGPLGTCPGSPVRVCDDAGSAGGGPVQRAGPLDVGHRHAKKDRKWFRTARLKQTLWFWKRGGDQTA
jgi:hypothetical protein